MINAAQFDFNAGPDMKGTWKNYKTGEVVNIRDTIIENNQIIGISDRGTQVPFTYLSSFVKSETNEPSHGPTNTKQSTPTRHAPAKEFIDDVDKELMGQSAGGTQTAGSFKEADPLRTPIQRQDTPTPRPDLNNHQPFQVTKTPAIDPAVEKVLDGLTKSECPTVTLNVKWNDIPEGVMFLKKYLGIPEEDLVKAILNKFIDIEDIRLKLMMQLTKIIEEGLNPKPIKEPKEGTTKKSKS